MRENAFRAYLSGSISGPSVSSYVSYAYRVERELGIDLDKCILDDDYLSVIAQRLRRGLIPPKSVQNCLSSVRSYSAFIGQTRCFEPDTASMNRTHPVESSERPSFIRDQSDQGLMRLYAQITDELRDRGVVRTANSPIGDYAESLFATAFNWILTNNSSAGFDALDEAKLSYQIKARRIGGGSSSRQLGALRNLDHRNFDKLAAVLFSETFDIIRAVIIPYETVLACARRSEHTNSWRVMLTDSLCAQAGVRDVTSILRATVSRRPAGKAAS